MELFDSLSLFDVQGPHSAQQIEGDEMVHNTGVSPIRQAPNSESIDRSRASHDQLQYNKELINADGSVACPVCVPQAPCGGCGIIVGDHDLCDCEYQTDRDDVAQPIKPFGRHHHDGLRRTTHSVHGKLNSANCGAKCRYDHGIMPDEYHSENNAAISKELEVLKQMMIVFAGLHFIPWLNNIGSGNNIAEPTPEKIAEAIKSLSAETSKIYEDHIVGRHSGAHCKPTVLAALLGNRRFAHDMVIGILGNVLVEQVLGHTWFGWDLSNGSYEPMHKDTFDSEGARDDDLAGKRDSVTVKINFFVSMNSKRTFLGSRRCKDAEQCVGLHDTARPHDLGRHVDHIVAAIWQHIKPIYNLWSTPHSDGGPIPKGLAKHLRSLVAHAGLLSVKLAYDPYTVYTWTKPAYAAGTQGVMKGLKAMSLRYLYVSERASMTQRSSETIAEPWTWPLPVITTEKISNIDGARISNFDLGRTPVSESLAVPNENAKEKRQSKEDQNGTQSDTGIDTTAMIQKKGNAVTSRDSAAPGDIPMEGRNAPTFVGEEQVQEELVGQYRAGELP